MVKIAIAGGTGEVASEILDALIATGKHRIVLLSRKTAVSSPEDLPSTTRVQVDYNSVDQLTDTLNGIHTVLSFITTHTDPGNVAQKNLIDASIRAGVKKFAPSEWVTSKFDHMNWYAGKAEIRDYLKAINKDKKVLEYSLFQPGLFLNYFTYPYNSARHITPLNTQIDFQNRRALVPDNFENAKLTLTTAQDLANVVAKAIEYEGEWPVDGGIQGCELTVADLVKLGEELRGPFTIERLETDDLKAGHVKGTWLPKVSHPSIPPEQADAMSVMFTAGLTLGLSVGAMNVSNGWNKVFPDYTFTQPRPFLSEFWQGKA